jgi:hypothetical protein
MFSKILPEVKSLFKDIKDDILNKDAYKNLVEINESKVNKTQLNTKANSFRINIL